MKKLITALKRQNGFTLVELMVVVAIIGLLSAVAIPNFKKYQAKSKLTEAKLQLSAIYTAEATFFSDYNMYASCLAYMGYDPANEKSSRYFATGFPAGVVAINTFAVGAAENSGLKTGTTNTGECIVTAVHTADNNYFVSAKGIGAKIMSTNASIILNAAGAALVMTNGTPNTSYGSGINVQSDVVSMAWQASAVGFISGDNVLDTNAAGLNINERKIIKTAVQGY